MIYLVDCAIQRLNNLKQNNLNKRFIRFTFRPAQVFFKTLSIESGIEPVSLQLCSQALYRLRLAQVKNSPRANVFPAGDANLMQVMYLSIERSPQDTRDGMICTVPRPHLLGRVLTWPGHFGASTFGLFGLYPSSLSVCWIRSSSWESFIGFYI